MLRNKAKKQAIEAQVQAKKNRNNKNQKTVTKKVPVQVVVSLNADGTVDVEPPFTDGMPSLPLAAGMLDEAKQVVNNECNYRSVLASRELARRRQERAAKYNKNEKKRMHKAERKNK